MQLNLKSVKILHVGKPRVKIIDDAQPVEEGKSAGTRSSTGTPPAKVSKPVKQADSLIAQLNAELGIEEPKATETVIPPTESGVFREVEESSKPEEITQPRKIATSSSTPRNDKDAKIRSKKYLEATKDLDRSLDYSILEAIEQVKKNSISNFSGSLEAHINTRFPNIRGMVSLPFVSGKKRIIIAFGKEASDSGADLVGTDETLEEISKGKINFEILVVTPEWMPKLAKLAKILGPKGLMPNPKNGTVTTDLKKTVASFQEGQTEYKTEAKAPVMHIMLGKLSQPDTELESNIKLLLSTIGKSRIKKVTLAPTMGPSVKLNLSSF